MRLAIALVLVVACGKGDGTASTRDALIAQWKAAGLAPSAFTPAKDSPIGKDCAAGTVNGVDVMVCSFATEAEAKTSQDAGLQWVGDTTGMSTPKGTLLVIAADRKKADPSGTTINKLMK